jgi:hypothetical protein
VSGRPRHTVIDSLNLGKTDVSALEDPTKKRERRRKKDSRRERQSIARVRAAIAKTLATNAPKFEAWFAEAIAQNPLKGLALYKDFMEYYMPKLGRIEQTGTVEHKVSHFVPVTEREEAPKALPLDGEFTEVTP